MNEKRLFIGLSLPKKIQKCIAAIQTDNAKAKWYIPTNLHITLRFLGTIKTGQIISLQSQLSNIKSDGFDLNLLAPTTDNLPVLYLPVAGETEKLFALKKAVDNALGEIGYEEETRKFHPHATLDRLRSRWPEDILQGYISKYSDFQSDTFTVNSFSLFESCVTDKGREYIPLHHFSFS